MGVWGRSGGGWGGRCSPLSAPVSLMPGNRATQVVLSSQKFTAGALDLLLSFATAASRDPDSGTAITRLIETNAIVRGRQRKREKNDKMFNNVMFFFSAYDGIIKKNG